jgi:ribosomal protein S18 acetylase RimI-like enzyme
MGGTARTWRMRQWPNDATVAHLIFLDHLTVPTFDDIDAAVDHARRKGARVIRTSALFPRAAEIVMSSGFHSIDRLALLQVAIADVVDDLPAPRRRTSPMQPWHHRRVARVDQDAFGPLWGNDPTSLREIRRATPTHRARVVCRSREVVGFAIAGLAGSNGYLQRLAVGVDRRREGVARDLVTDAVRWMHGRRASTAYVNTGTSNAAALELYDGLGFVRLDHELQIAELRLA